MSDADPDFVAWLKGVPVRLRATPWSRMESAWNAGVAHERARLLPQIDALEENRREWLAWADSRDADLAAAEARGAALAMAQVRRMAEEVVKSFVTVSCDCGYTVDLDSDGDGVSAGRALRDLAAALPASPDLAAEVRRIEERGASRLRSSLEAIAAKGCAVIHSGSPRGTTCLDVIAESYAKPGGSSDGYRRQIRSRKWACQPCQAKAALDGSEARMFAADLIEGGTK